MEGVAFTVARQLTGGPGGGEVTSARARPLPALRVAMQVQAGVS